MFEDYKEKQSAFYNYLTTSLKNNKISHAYLIETNGVSYAYDLAISLAKFFLCDNDHTSLSCDFCKNLDINNYPDIKVIDSLTKVIKKEQLIELQNDFKVKPIYGKYLIYIIKDANLLNKASANTILKFLEEPSDDIIAILLTDNVYNVIDTIVSRCQVLSLVPETLIFDGIFKDYKDIDRDSKIRDIINFYVRYEDVNTYIMTDTDVYRFKDEIALLLNIGLYLYFDVLNILLGRDIVYFKEFDDSIRKIVKNNEISDIIWKIDLINQFIINTKFNVNKELFIDNFIISLGGRIDD